MFYAECPPRDPTTTRVRLCLHAVNGSAGRIPARLANPSAASKHRLHVVAVRIEHERSVISRRVAFPQPRLAIVDAARLESGGVECVDLGPVPGHETRVLPDGVRMEPIDPENGIIHTVSDGIDAVSSGNCIARRMPSAPRAAS